MSSVSSDNKTKPKIRRTATSVIVPLDVWDELMVRLLAAEADEKRATRSWWRP